MNTLVISDTHLGKYDKQKDRFLRNLIKDYDRIIINGDFWDNWGGCSFSEFINSRYKELFKLLKSKETIYIYGNHDTEAAGQKELANIFANVQGSEYELQIGKYKYHFEHGHRFFYDNPSIKFINIYPAINKLPILGRLVYELIKYSYKLFPKRSRDTRVGRKKNKYIKELKTKDTFLVTGHTHLSEIDEGNMYINTGCIMDGCTTYVIINKKGEPKLVESQWYNEE